MPAAAGAAPTSGGHGAAFLRTGVWPLVVIVVLAPLALGGLVQVAVGNASPVLILAVIA